VQGFLFMQIMAIQASHTLVWTERESVQRGLNAQPAIEKVNG
jgi:hypothetical protein